MVVRKLWSVDRNVRATSAVKGEEVGREVEGFELRNESEGDKSGLLVVVIKVDPFAKLLEITTR